MEGWTSAGTDLMDGAAATSCSTVWRGTAAGGEPGEVPPVLAIGVAAGGVAALLPEPDPEPQAVRTVPAARASTTTRRNGRGERVRRREDMELAFLVGSMAGHGCMLRSTTTTSSAQPVRVRPVAMLSHLLRTSSRA